MTMNDLVLIGKALSDPTRVRILVGLIESELCVCELVDALELGQSTLSTHLQIIRQSGMVETTRAHKMVYYSLSEEHRPLVKNLILLNEESFKADKRIRRDLLRIGERLQLRQAGQCCLGPGQLDRMEQLKK